LYFYLQIYANFQQEKLFSAKIFLFSLSRAATLNPVKHYQIHLELVQISDYADPIVLIILKNFLFCNSIHVIFVCSTVGEEHHFFQYFITSHSQFSHAD